MTSMQSQPCLLFALFIGSIVHPSIATAQVKQECLASLPGAIFSGDEGVKILVTGFGYPDQRADLFGTRYVSILQTLTGVNEPGTSSADASKTRYTQAIHYLPCEVSSHSAARELGQQAGADLVLWGQVQWRNWQTPHAQPPVRPKSTLPPQVLASASPPKQEPARPESEATPGSGAPKEVINSFSGDVGEIHQNYNQHYIYAVGPATAMLNPRLTAVRWTGLEIDAEHLIQISDHSDLKHESASTLFGSRHQALIQLLLACRAIDRRDDIGASQYVKNLIQHWGTNHVNLLRRARDAVVLLQLVGSSLIRSENYDLGFPYLQRAVESCDPADIHCLAEGHDVLGWAYRQKGALDEALTHYRKALNTWERTQKPDKVAATHLAMAEIFYEKQEYVDVIYHLNKQISIDRQQEDKYQVRLARGMSLLGNAYSINGEYKKALHSLNRSFDLYDELDGKYEVQMADILNHLGNSYYQLKEYNRAIEMHEKEIDIWRRQNQNHNQQIAERLDDIAASYNHLGNAGEAISHYEQAAARYLAAKPPDSEEAFGSLRKALSLCLFSKNPALHQRAPGLRKKLDAVSLQMQPRIVD